MINDHYQPVPLSGEAGLEAGKFIAKLAERVHTDEIDPGDYRAEVARRTRDYQYEVYWHYLRSIHRYPPKRLLQTLVGALRRRLA